MDNWDKRVQATVFIWLASAIAIGVSGFGAGMNSGGFNVYMLGIAIVVALAALISTAVVWTFDSDIAKHGKAKREAGNGDVRALLLAQLLDDDERLALKRELLNDLKADGESVSLAELLGTQDAAHERQHRA